MEQRATAFEAGRPPLMLGRYRLDLAHAELRSPDGGLVALRRQALDVLMVLARQAGHVVGKDELLEQVWPKVVVGDDSLAQAIAEIRRVIGDRDHRLVRTIARRGYLLVPDPVAVAAAAPAAAPAVPPASPPTPSPDSARAVPARPSPAMASPTLGIRARRRAAPAVAGLVAVVLAIVAVAVGSGAWPDRTPPRPTAPEAPARIADPSAGPSARPFAPTRSLVVLPFGSEAGDADQAWFADALTGDLTSALSSFRDLTVIGHGTAARYAEGVDPRDVARELGVSYVVQGRVRRDGDRIRLVVSMADAESGAQRWSETQDIERGRLGRSIDDLKGGLAKTLLIELGESIGARLDRMHPEQAEADDLAMRGFAIYLRNLGPATFAEAAGLFDQAVVLDPNSVRGLAGVSMANTMSVLFGWAADRETAVRKAEAALSRLESIDASHHLTLLARAGLSNFHADWEGLLAASTRLLAQFPSEPTSHHHRCSALLRLGRFDDSIPACERAIRISPRDSRVAVWQGLIAMNHFMRSDTAKAAEHARHSVTANPRIPFYQLLLAASLVGDGREEEALRVIAQFKSRHADFDLAAIPVLWRGTDPVFVAGRDRIAAIAADLLAR